MAKTTVICVKFFPVVACQKLLKLANVSRNYSENKSGRMFFRHGVGRPNQHSSNIYCFTNIQILESEQRIALVKDAQQ